MEVRNVPQPRRNRCSLCRQEGHNCTRCPFDMATATSLRDQFNRNRREARRQQLPERSPETSWRQEVYEQVVDMQRRLNALQTEPRPTTVSRSGPTVRERKIQEIIFDNAKMIPNGLYKQLMDALVIRD